MPCCAGARPCDWLRSPGAGGGGWGALRASAAPRRVSQRSDREEVVEADGDGDDEEEEEQERVTKFDPAASPAAGRLIRFVPRSVPHSDERRNSHFPDRQQGHVPSDQSVPLHSFLNPRCGTRRTATRGSNAAPPRTPRRRVRCQTFLCRR